MMNLIVISCSLFALCQSEISHQTSSGYTTCVQHTGLNLEAWSGPSRWYLQFPMEEKNPNNVKA